jgi:subtilisin family serine protease
MSRFTGKGIRVAVLDTGFDLTHPDFAGRKITAQSFVPDEEVQDGHGHGTHCIGTACGPMHPHRLPRYGVAYESEIFAGKVLSNRGSGADSGILAGIHWAITQGCQVVSMSLGATVQPGDGFSQVFEEVASRALEAGTLIIAAAGNESQRPFRRAPVDHPANCPSIMAVGALTQRMSVAFFSNAGINPHGGQVDIVAPGEKVISSWPQPRLYNDLDGTSMATPHVAGIAALLAEAHPETRGRALAGLLVQTARRLEWSACDVGAGLVQAP